MKAQLDWENKRIYLEEPVTVKRISKFLAEHFCDWEEWEIVGVAVPKTDVCYCSTITK